MSDTVQRALVALREARARIEALERDRCAPIAIIGLACRFPGGEGEDAFWTLLNRGGDAVGEITRWDVSRYFDADHDALGKTYCRQAGEVADIDTFDADFFGITPREARTLDPQQRMLLEVGWHALEDAAVAPELIHGQRTGVFVGVGQTDYARFTLDGTRPQDIEPHAGSGMGMCFASGRLAFHLAARGPAMTVDTACSSSLVALHLAVQSLRLGELDLAVAGGVQLSLSPEITLYLARTGALAPDGHCKAFSAEADGYGRGEGCGVVILKRLSEAVADGDRVRAVIRGSAVNHDGPSGGLTVPAQPAQEQVVRSALQQAGVSASEVSYVECHGTGTALGDPIEVGALASVFGGRARPLAIGSVKGNIGHLEAAAGIAGLIKVVLALEHGRIPAHLHCRELSRRIPWSEIPIEVATEARAWPEGRRLAGVSSFGMSGTNAHVVVEAAPAAGAAGAAASRHVLLLSAKTPQALRALAASMAAILPGVDAAAACWTANTGRGRFRWRLAVTGTDGAALAKALGQAAPVEVRGAPRLVLVGDDDGTWPLAPVAVMSAAEAERSSEPALFFSVGPQRPATLPAGAQWLGPLARDAAAAALFTAGLDLDWRLWAAPQPKISLPSYPFQRERFWVEGVRSELLHALDWVERERRSLPVAGRWAVVGEGEYARALAVHLGTVPWDQADFIAYCPDLPGEGAAADLLAAQERALAPLLALLPRLEGWRGKLWLAGEDFAAPWRWSLPALARVIARERGEIWGGVADGPAALVAEELCHPEGEDWVRLGRTRRVARLVRRPSGGSWRPRGDATYLITGAGALGALLAERLRAQGAGRVVVASRSSDVRVDMGDAGSVRALIGQLDNLKGVFHLAGVLDDGLLSGQDWPRFGPGADPQGGGGVASARGDPASGAGRLRAVLLGRRGAGGRGPGQLRRRQCPARRLGPLAPRPGSAGAGAGLGGLGRGGHGRHPLRARPPADGGAGGASDAGRRRLRRDGRRPGLGPAAGGGAVDGLEPPAGLGAARRAAAAGCQGRGGLPGPPAGHRRRRAAPPGRGAGARRRRRGAGPARRTPGGRHRLLRSRPRFDDVDGPAPPPAGPDGTGLARNHRLRTGIGGGTVGLAAEGNGRDGGHPPPDATGGTCRPNSPRPHPMPSPSSAWAAACRAEPNCPRVSGGFWPKAATPCATSRPTAGTPRRFPMLHTVPTCSTT